MIKNMGTVDRAVRMLVAIIFLVLMLTKVVHGAGLIIMAVFGVYFVLTSIFAFCPLYTIVGIHTLRTKSGNDV